MWICPYPGGHIQATGIDARGPQAVPVPPALARCGATRRSSTTWSRFARALPRCASASTPISRRDDLAASSVLACAVRLLDRGFFRIGSEDYAVTNETYGLATMSKRHVTVARATCIVFDYPAKHGKRRVQAVVDPDVAEVVSALQAPSRRRRRSCWPTSEGRRWVDVRSADINEYLKDATGVDVAAKDFRTWGATVLAARRARRVGPQRATRRPRASARWPARSRRSPTTSATRRRSRRASYIDPRVFDTLPARATRSAPRCASWRDPDATAIQGAAERGGPASCSRVSDPPSTSTAWRSGGRSDWRSGARADPGRRGVSGSR